MKIRRIKEYVGPVELGIVALLIIAAAFLIDNSIEKDERELPPPPPAQTDSKPVQTGGFNIGDNLSNPIFKVMDNSFRTSLVDTLCVFFNDKPDTGCLTLKKGNPNIEALRSTEKEYYMWVEIPDFFAAGQLLTVTDILEGETLIQFYFRLAEPESALLDMLERTDSITRNMSNNKPEKNIYKGVELQRYEREK